MTEAEAAALEPTDAGPGNSSAVSIGRYMLHRQIARGGMATIHIARLMGDEGFSRIVAAKRLLPEFAEDSEFVAMFLDEARIASKVHHRNVVPVLDVVTTGDEVVLVQEYVHGAPLHWLLNKARQTKSLVPVNIAVSIACQVLAGLHAAHETVDEMGMPLNVVHRDVSPQNVMIASDGTARLLDFGVAKSLMAAHVTREGTYKGKLAYSAPEQLRGAATRQSDVYSLTVLLWELVVGHRMHRTAQGEAELVATIMNGKLPTITEALSAEREWEAIDDEHWRQLQALEPIVKRGLSVEIRDRFQTAAEMEDALVAIVRPASSTAVAQWLKSLGKEYMEKHDKVLALEEASWRRGGSAPPSFRRGSASSAPKAALGTRIGSVPAPDDAVPSTPYTLPNAPQTRAPYALIGLLSLLVVALAIGIVVVVRSPGESAPPSTATTPPPAAPAAPAAAPAAAAPAAAAPAAKTVEPAAPAAAPEAVEPALSIGEVETSPSSATVKKPPVVRPPQSGRPAVRASGASRSAAPPAAKQPAATPAPEPPPPAVETPAPKPAAPKDNCTPPYYFEGSKKIFKPACL